MEKSSELFASSIIFWETSYGPGNKSTSTKMLDTCHIKKNVIIDANLMIAFDFAEIII